MAVPTKGKLHAILNYLNGGIFFYRKSSFSYKTPSYYPCGFYSLRQGCVGVEHCSGQYLLNGTTKHSPVMTPTEVPTNPPSHVSPMSYSNSSPFVSCPKYQTVNSKRTDNNFTICSFIACPSTIVSIPCGACNGDQYIAVLDSSDYQIQSNDDSQSCSQSLCSSIVFVTNSKGPCQVYKLLQGCYGISECGGQFTIYNAYNVNATIPLVSSSVQPTARPSILCPAYSAFNTNFAEANYVNCSFVGCSNTPLFISPIATSSFNAFAILRSSQGSLLQRGYSFTYTTGASSGCQLYQLQQGCWYSDACAAQYTVQGANSLAPTMLPTGPSQFPSAVPFSVTCPYFTTLYSPYACSFSSCPNCTFISCPSQTIQIQLTNASSNNFQNFYLYDPDGNLLEHSSIWPNEKVSYSTASSGQCAFYTLGVTCGDYGQSCGGAYVVYGAIAIPTSPPSARPSNPSLFPTPITTSLIPSIEATSIPSIMPVINCPFYMTSNAAYAAQVARLIFV